MPRTCTICNHPKRIDIDAAILRSEPLRNLAKQYGASSTALFRHKTDHIAKQLAKAKEVSEIASATVLLDELRELAENTREVLSRAVKEENGDLALKAIARLERQLELKGRLLGEIKEPGGTKNRIEVVYVDKALIVGPSERALLEPKRASAEMKVIECTPAKSV